MLDKCLRPIGIALVAAFLLVACTSVEKVYNIYALTDGSPDPSLRHAGQSHEPC